MGKRPGRGQPQATPQHRGPQGLHQQGLGRHVRRRDQDHLLQVQAQGRGRHRGRGRVYRLMVRHILQLLIFQIWARSYKNWQIRTCFCIRIRIL